MKFCAKCGTKLEEEKNFCSKCGYRLNVKPDKAIEENIENTQVMEKVDIDFADNTKIISDSNPIRNNSSFSKKVKISMAIISVVTVVLIGLYITASSLTEPSKIVLRFQNAVASDNKGELVNLLYSNDSRMEINEESIVPLLNYFKDNPSYFNTAIQELNKNALKLEQFKGLVETGGNSSKGVLSLTNSGKKFLFFPDYKIAIKPSFIQVKTGIKDVDISLDSRKIGQSDSDNYNKEFGPYVPGKYKLLANYKGKYVSLNEPWDIDLVANNGKANVDVLAKLSYINVSSQYQDAELFVDGKDTGVKIADAQNFGPLNSNTKVYATVTRDGKTMKSDEYIVGQGDSNINLSFSKAENIARNIEGDLHDLIRWYTYYFTQAVNYNNFEMVEDYLYPGSKLYYDQKSYVPSTYSRGIRETILSFNILSYTLSDDNKSGTITTQEVYNIYSNGKSSVKTYKYTYTFKYNELKGHFQLDTIDTTGN